MNKKRLLILPLVFALSSCSWIGPDTKNTVKNTANIYTGASTMSLDVPLLSDLKVAEIQYRTIKNEPLIPYMTIKEYAKIFEPYLSEDATSKVTDLGAIVQWTVTVKATTQAEDGSEVVEDKTVFMAIVDFLDEVASVGGSFTSAYASKGDDPSVYTKGMKIDEVVLNEEEVISAPLYSFKGFGFKKLRVGGSYYLPVGLLDHLFSKQTTYSVYSTFKDFFVISNYLTIAITFFKETEDGARLTPIEVAKTNALKLVDKTFPGQTTTQSGQVVDTVFPVMPLYFREYNRNSILYVFERLYGLKSTRGLKTMRTYFESDSHFDDLLSEDASVRAEAYNYLIGNLADGHTSIASQNTYVWGEKSATRYFSKLWEERIKLRNNLAESMLESYRKYDYDHASNAEEREAIASSSYTPDKYSLKLSDDGKLAFFSFDSFIFGLEEPGPDFYTKDTFTYFVRQFEDIKNNHKGVEDVVIDLSTNGGGIVIALIKILALISKDNNVFYDQYSENTNAKVRLTASVDTNEDGKYDSEDVYGDDYNIYLLTSPYSFSCGNAYPFLAKKEGLATLIGTKSGGGECSVDSTMIASGQFLNHSSLTHIGYHEAILNEAGEVDHYEYNSVEGGAVVDSDFAINYENYFNFNYLAKFIQDRRN